MSVGPFIVALLGVAGFAVALIYFRIIAVVRGISGTASQGVTTMLDASLDDDAKEQAVRQAGLNLLKQSWQIAWRVALALAAVFPPILVADWGGLVPQEDSLSTLMRIDFIVIVSVAAIALTWLLGKRKHSQAEMGREKITDSSAYGAGDRLMHALAFSGPGVQMTLAKLDDRLFARQIAEVPETPPIFITSLARGGTTALLNALHDLPEIATHRYIDMPFMSAPLLWSRLAGGRSGIQEQERSHGDGLKIGLQSPEAFDEIFWMLFWPEKYHETHIDLWYASDGKPAAQDFFRTHFRKIVRLRHPEQTSGVRYLSKNNANIARLALLPKSFPDCQILVPLREPSAHAASLFRQHRNFSELHVEDAFSKRYMRDIGHLEFGPLHRPIDFARDSLSGFDRDRPDYWLAYWISCFEHVANHTGSITLITQDAMRAAPGPTMEALVDRLGLKRTGSKAWQHYFRPERDQPKDEMFDNALLKKARALYADLSKLSLKHQ